VQELCAKVFGTQNILLLQHHFPVFLAVPLDIHLASGQLQLQKQDNQLVDSI
jgi:hypothetical protein